MTIQSLSKRAASKYRPERPTLLISIQDGDKKELPFRQRTNHITRKRYVDCLFLYFDDVNPDAIPGQPTMPFAFSDVDAKAITTQPNTTKNGKNIKTNECAKNWLAVVSGLRSSSKTKTTMFVP